MMKFFQKQKNKIENKKLFLKNGFTIVETIVALFIFSVSITAMMGVFSRGIQNTNYAKNKMIATYLAQEGIEYIRNLRDNYVYFGEVEEDWMNFYTSKLSPCINNICYFDNSGIDFINDKQMISNLLLSECFGGVCPNLKYDSNTGSYNYVTGVNSGFIRQIRINDSWDPFQAIEVVSTVSFTNGSVSFSEYLYNLTPQPTTP